MKLPNEIEQFLTHNPDYESGCADADLMQQLQTGGVHPFIIHNCARETWAVFVETDDLVGFMAAYPAAIAATFNGMILESMAEQ
jgi:hypothetical protein